MARVRLGELLIQEGKIDNEQLKSALGYQRQWGKKIGECLIRLDMITESDLCDVLSQALKIPRVNLAKIDPTKITRDILNQVPVQFARSEQIVPISVREIKGKKRLIVATSDPTNYSKLDELQFKSANPVLVTIAPESDIDWFIRRYYLGETESLPRNYASEPSVETSDGEEMAAPDPISSIFYDQAFTNVTKHHRRRNNDE